MSNRSKCIANTKYTDEGVRIDGHDYVALLAFEDVDHARWYYVDRCENCGHCIVAFSSQGTEAEYYPERSRVGGA